MRFCLNRFRTTVLLTLLFCLLATPAPGQDTPPIEKVGNMIEAKQFEKADSLVKSILEREPRNELALGYVIKISQERGDRDRAYKAYRRLSDREPEQFQHFKPYEVYYNTAQLAYQMGDYSFTIEQINRAQAQLSEDKSGLYKEMRGWKLRAQAARERLKGQERKQQLRRLTNEVVKRLSEREWDKALKFVRRQGEAFSGARTYENLLEIVTYLNEVISWTETVNDLDGTSSSQRLRGMISKGEGYLNEKQLRRHLEEIPGEENNDVLKQLNDDIRNSLIKPRLAKLYYLLGHANYQNEQFKDALESALKARSMESEPRPETYLLLAKTNLELGRPGEARDFVYRIRQTYPDFTISRSLDWSIWLYHWGPSILYFIVAAGGVVGLGIYLIPRFAPGVLTSMGEYVGERAFHQDWVELSFWLYHLFCDPERMDPGALEKYLRVASRSGNSDKQLELLGRGFEAGNLQPDDEVEYGRLLRARDVDQSKDILESALEKWAELSPRGREKLASNLSQIYLEAGDHQRGYKLLKKLLQHQGPSSKLLKRLSQLSSSLGRWDEWLSLGREWYKFVSDSYVQSSQRRVIGETTEEKELADPERIAETLIEQYEGNRDVDLSSESSECLEFLLEMMEEAGAGDDEQLRLLEELLDRDLPPTDYRSYGRRVADIYMKRDQVDRALGILESLRDEFPGDLEILTRLASVYVDRDNREEAYNVLLDILDVQKDNVEARNQLHKLGRRYEEDNKFQEAERFYRAILEHSSFDQPETQLRLGAVLYKQDKTEEALSTFQEINQGETEFKAKILGFIGRCLVDLGMHDVAVERMKEIDLSDGSIPRETRRTLYYWRGRAHEEAGQKDKALEDYRQIMGSSVDYRDVSERVKSLERESADSE